MTRRPQRAQDAGAVPPVGVFEVAGAGADRLTLRSPRIVELGPAVLDRESVAVLDAGAVPAPRATVPGADPLVRPRVGPDLRAGGVGRDPSGRVAVSRDLLTPIVAGTANGARYRATVAVGAGVTDDLIERRRQRRGRPSKAYREHKLPGRIVRQTLSVWDLLLPVLQPPLALAPDARAVAERCDLPHRLYRYQLDGVAFLRSSRSALLADEMGTGKTVMSTVALRLLFREARARRALIVCPLSVLPVWDQHLAEWAPELSVTLVHGTTRTRWADWRCPAHVWVTTFDTLRADLIDSARAHGEPLLPPEVAAAFDLVLLDEAQNVKNRESGRSQAVRRLRPQWRWALSGTPIENRLADLQALFAFVRPGLLPNEDLTPALASDLIGPYVKRRTKADVMKELPPKIRQDVWLELDPAQKRAYADAEDAARRELDDLGSDMTRMHVFQVLGRLKAICNFAPGGTDSPKLRETVARVEEIAASGKKVLIFTQWVRDGVDKIEAALAPFGVVKFDARLDAAKRRAAVQRFREDPAITVFLATVKSAGVGLTLTEASYVIHFDHWWNPAWMWQAEDRAHRRGQTEPVNVYSLWTAGTIEQRVQELLEKKGLLHEEVVGGLSENASGGLITVDEWVGMLR